MPSAYRTYSLGETAIAIDFGNVIDEDINKFVIALFDWWKENKITGIRDIIPAYSSLTLVYDIEAIRNHSDDISAFEFVKKILEASVKKVTRKKTSPSRQIEIPVCYDLSFAPDLKFLAAKKNLPIEKAIELHIGQTYRVYMIGFLPGFAYMGKVHKQISLPRKSNPRMHVDEGSVGIAGDQTGIYPMNSPGGWNIIGRTPVRLFDSKKSDPVLLHAGDEVQFIPINLKQFHLAKSKQ